MCPQDWHIRRCTQRVPSRRQSSQPAISVGLSRNSTVSRCVQPAMGQAYGPARPGRRCWHHRALAMEDTSTFVTVALPVALALIMGTLGLSLAAADFRRVAEQPRGVLIGLANLFVVSPLLGFGV